jgi:predicted nucleic acid-binding protein
VRVSSNLSAISTQVTPREALTMLERIRRVPGRRFIEDDLELVVGPHLGSGLVATHRQVTDAHLLALARRHGGRLATFDRGIAALDGGEDVELVPIG